MLVLRNPHLDIYHTFLDQKDFELLRLTIWFPRAINKLVYSTVYLISDSEFFFVISCYADIQA